MDTGKTGGHACQVCQKTYGRADHLARHMRMHTNERPFACDQCGKAFARADLLRRHAALHAESSTRRPNGRVTQACTECASSKIKCDEGKPCTRCSMKKLDCSIAAAQGQTVPHKDLSIIIGNQTETTLVSAPEPEQTGHISALPTPPELGISSELFVGQCHVPGSAPDHFRDFFKDIFQDESLPNDLQSAFSSNVHLLGMPQNFVTATDAGISEQQAFLLGGLDDLNAWLDVETASMWNGSAGEQLGYNTGQTIESSIVRSSEAYKRSPWTWVPSVEKGAQDQIHLAACPERDGSRTQSQTRPSVLAEALDHRTRGRIIGMLMTVCDEVNYSDIVSSFPSVAILNNLINDFISASELDGNDFIHAATLSLSNSKEELLAALIAGGAVTSPLVSIQKFGYALQETLRLSLPKIFERDNRFIRALPSLQAFTLCQEVGIWSGDRRVTEISEGVVLPLVAMLRRGYFFRTVGKPTLPPLLSDDDAALNSKWEAWVQRESYKRAVFRVWVHVSQVSIALQTPPVISYAEITLEPPAPRRLWRARSPIEWRDYYLATGGDYTGPTLMQCMFDLNKLSPVRGWIDLRMSLNLILMSHWTLVWEFRQLQSAIQAQPSGNPDTSAPVPSSKGHDLCTLMARCQVVIDDWGIVDHRLIITAELIRMNLYVSLQDLHILAGKDGLQEARAILPLLKAWQQSSSARRAVWHAGQLLRAIKYGDFGKTGWYGLRDFNAVALYHAALSLWVFGVIARLDTANSGSAISGDYVVLNGHAQQDGAKRDRFFDLGKGRPVLSRHLDTAPNADMLHVTPGCTQGLVQLTEPHLAIELAVDLMQSACDPVVVGPTTKTRRPNLVENLIQLMKDLGSAAADQPFAMDHHV